MAEEITLSPETTTEEIQSFVDEIASERMGDKAEPQKTDAEIVNSVAAIETPAAPPKGDETADDHFVDANKKVKSEKTDDRAWLDDDLKSEVSAYGIGEDELADFTSREEVQRALRFFDKSALETGRKALAEADSEPKEPTRDDKGRFVPKGETESAAKAEPETKPVATAGYEVKLDKAVYDDEIVDEFTRLRDHYESRLETLEARFLQADAEAEERHFDSLVDSLGHTDLFGKADKEDAKQLERRRDLHVQVKAMMNGMASLGRPTEMSESLISRVAKMVFAEELGKKELKSRTSRISRQSNGRQGGGATRPSEPRETPREWADQLWKEMAGS